MGQYSEYHLILYLIFFAKYTFYLFIKPINQINQTFILIPTILIIYNTSYSYCPCNVIYVPKAHYSSKKLFSKKGFCGEL